MEPQQRQPPLRHLEHPSHARIVLEQPAHALLDDKVDLRFGAVVFQECLDGRCTPYRVAEHADANEQNAFHIEEWKRKLAAKADANGRIFAEIGPMADALPNSFTL
jgi:hypothetical protein